MKTELVVLFALIGVSLADTTITTEAPDPTTEGDSPWATYPPVDKTASINGFADKIYDDLPECAKPCMFADTGKTPCPYWDTGCLCIMPMFAGDIGDCVADSCKGNDVLDMRSLATSICSSAGVWDPYWMPPQSVSDALDAAAAATDAEETPEPTEETTVETEEPTEEPTSTEEPTPTDEPTEESTQPPTTDAPTTTTTTTSVIRTATINGFADRIYDDLPECAKPCMYADYNKTPCPYWDTGCLCVMPMFAGDIGECVADSCKGNDVLEMRSLATSACSVAGVGDPFWKPPQSVSELLESAASATDAEVTTDPTPDTTVETEEPTQPPITDAPEASDDNPWATYPPVDKTASINGFADKIYDDLPECAKPCMFADTGKTPCPYWDTGCLCIMPMFAGDIGECVAESCKGKDVLDMRTLATSICSSAGVWDPYWMPPQSVSDALDAAAKATDVEETSAEPTSSVDPTADPSDSADPEPTADPNESSSTISSVETSAEPSTESTIVSSVESSDEPSTESSTEASVDPSEEPSTESTTVDESSSSSADPSIVDPSTVDPDQTTLLTTTSVLVTETSTICEESFTYTNQTSSTKSKTKEGEQSGTEINTKTVDVTLTKTKTLCTKCKTVTKTEGGVVTTAVEDDEEITIETESPKQQQQGEEQEEQGADEESGEQVAPGDKTEKTTTKGGKEIAGTTSVSSEPKETNTIDQVNAGNSNSITSSVMNFVVIAMSLVYFL